MTINEKYEMNRIIGIFMGGKIISSTSHDRGNSEILIENWKVPQGIPAYDDNAKIGYFDYHSRWDRLMTVVEKIEEMNYTIIINRTTCKIIEDYKIYPSFERFGNTKIESVYLAISDFIKNYNHEEFEKMHEKENNSI